VHQRFSGSWTFSPSASGRWIATDIALAKVSGATPILDASSCAPAPQPAPAYSSSAGSGSCDPNYVGACLDPNSIDYDCEGGSGNGPDYTGPVQVVGDDHYGLDRDGDGYACES
jgi:hypothetical protein